MRFSLRVLFLAVFAIATILGIITCADRYALSTADVSSIQTGMHQRDLLRTIGSPHRVIDDYTWGYRVWDFDGYVEIDFDDEYRVLYLTY